MGGTGAGSREQGAAYDPERTRRALEALRGGGDPVGVRPPIQASWRRSQAHGVGGGTLTAPYDEDALDLESPLVRAADPVLDQLARDLTHSPSCVALADARGRILRRVTGDPRFDATLDEVLVAPGFDYSERWVGTNALGTALHDRELVVVHEREHFHDQLAGLCCSAVPVRDPLTGRLLGVLGIAAPARSGDASWSALARQSGLLVENRLFDLHADGQRELYAGYLAALRQRRHPVFAVGPDLLRAPPEVRQQLVGLDHDQLWARVVDALAHRGDASVLVTLADGREVRVRLRAFEHAGRLVGALGELRAVEERRAVPERSGPVVPMPEYAAWSAPVRAAAAALRRLADERRPVCVVGEPGTGKAHLVEVVARRVLPERPLVTVEADGDYCPDKVAAHLVAGSPVLLRHAERVGPAALDDLLLRGGEDRHGWLAVTWRGEPDGLGAVTPAFRVVALPPLRSRPDDVVTTVDRVLRDHPAGRGVSFTPALLERLRRQPWPTNLAGLAEAVEELLAYRQGPVIDVTALNDVLSARVRRRLTPVEWLLRTAIEDALRAHGGNKEAAAAALGVSRASIYRKIKSLDIDVHGLRE